MSSSQRKSTADSLIFEFFRPSVNTVPRELKKLIRKYIIGYDNHSVQSVAGKLSCRRTALKCCKKWRASGQHTLTLTHSTTVSIAEPHHVDTCK